MHHNIQNGKYLAPNTPFPNCTPVSLKTKDVRRAKPQFTSQPLWKGTRYSAIHWSYEKNARSRIWQSLSQILSLISIPLSSTSIVMVLIYHLVYKDSKLQEQLSLFSSAKGALRTRTSSVGDCRAGAKANLSLYNSYKSWWGVTQNSALTVCSMNIFYICIYWNNIPTS